jgi:hypothetical protein
MGKTRKQYPHGGFHRRPKGKKQAMQAGVERKKAIPPDAWDDLNYDDQVWKPWKIAKKLWKNGKPWEYIRKKLKEAHKLTSEQVNELRRRLK